MRTIPSRYQPDLRNEFFASAESWISGKLHGRTKTVHAYETALRQAFNSSFVVTCNSGTSAIELALRASTQQGPGVVIMPALTPLMTFLPVDSLKLRTVIVDIQPCNLFCSPSSYLELPISSAPPGSTLLTTSWWGYSPDWKQIREICNLRKWHWIDDCSQAHGFIPDGGVDQPDFRCYSTHDRKLVTTGEGGFLCCRHEDFARRAASFASYGGLPAGHNELALGLEPGSNRRLSTLQAAYGLASFEGLSARIEARLKIAARLSRLLTELDTLVLHPQTPGSTLNGYGLVLWPQKETATRHFGAKFLNERGIQNDVFDYDLKAIDEYPLFQDRRRAAHTPNARSVARQAIVLSPHEGLRDTEITYIESALKDLHDALQR